MKRILVLGAGKSATTLIDYLIDHAHQNQWQITIADRDVQQAIKKVEGRPEATAMELDIANEAMRYSAIKNADLVVSMLPAFLHIHAAKDCVATKTDLVTASYVSDEIMELDVAAKKAGILLMNEIGADPGIDHMSAMEMIDRLRHEGGTITSFQSYCGGLIAPESDTNPWHYKVAWNPWNIVRAGSGGADFLMNGKEYHRPYEELYHNATELEVLGYGTLAAYANRDSLKYIDTYALKNAHTVLRATLRHPDFMIGWSAMISLGLTDDNNEFDVTGLTFEQWFLKASKNIKGENLAEKLISISAGENAFFLIENLGITSNEKIEIKGEQSPGKVLQSIIVKQWELMDDDKDVLIFHHDIEYEIDGNSHQLESSMIIKGDNQTDTAMAKCVGLPMAIFIKLFLTTGFENLTGVQIPTMKQVYEPVLKELKQHGIFFEEK